MSSKQGDHARDLQHIMMLLQGLPQRPGWSLESQASGDVVTLSTTTEHTTEWMSCREEDMVQAVDHEDTR